MHFASCGKCLIRLACVLGPLELHLKSLHANLETIHGLNGSLGTGRVVEAHKTYQTQVQVTTLSGSAVCGDTACITPPITASVTRAAE